jgi:hypothetical protein
MGNPFWLKSSYGGDGLILMGIAFCAMKGHPGSSGGVSDEKKISITHFIAET